MDQINGLKIDTTYYVLLHQQATRSYIFFNLNDAQFIFELDRVWAALRTFFMHCRKSQSDAFNAVIHHPGSRESIWRLTFEFWSYERATNGCTILATARQALLRSHVQ